LNLTLNVAQLGYMWDSAGNNQIAGLYIDNKDDIQFPQTNGRSNISELMQEWLNPQPGTGNSGWNALGEVYDNAPAVEIELFPTEAETVRDPYDTVDGTYEVVQDPSPGSAGFSLDTIYTDGNGQQIWWPNHFIGGGEPGIRITRGADDGGIVPGQCVIGEPAAIDRIGESISSTMYVDYPADGHAVIYAEGNVRIKGRLPASTGRRYDLTVVSGGTIYIDGQILSPQDQYGRDVDGSTPALISDEDNTYIALLARDCVVVNPTMLVPQFTHKQGNISSQDDPQANGLAKHWQMQPSQLPANINSAGSQFYFGAQPTGDVTLCAYKGLESTGVITSTTLAADVTAGDFDITVTDDVSSWIPATHKLLIIDIDNPAFKDEYNFTAAAGTQISLSPNAVRNYPAGSEVINLSLGPPDVTGISLGRYDPASGGWVPYDFDVTSVSTNPSEPIFVLTRKYLGLYDEPPWVWEGSSVWAPLYDTYLPWPLSGYIDTGPGVLNALQFVMPLGTEIDTANGGNSNAQPYLLKKFKLLEYDASSRITGSIHAKINAVMYAQNGCFFVIPGRYFKEDVNTVDAREYLRYNYDIEIRGAITENFHPGPAVVREWQEKWAWPYTDPSSSVFHWNSIRYIYDETLLASRGQVPTELVGVRRYCPPASAGPSLDLVKVPLLPASPDLLYYGEVP